MQTPKLCVKCFKTRLPALGILLLALFAMHPARADNWTYIVEDGDTLWDIASRYLRVQSFWRNLKILNQVNDPLHIPPGTHLQIPIGWLRQQPFLVKVQFLSGKVEALNTDTMKLQAVSVGDELNSGQTLYTGTDSTITLEFPDGSKLLLQAESQLNLNALGKYGPTEVTNTQLLLEQGRVETQVTPRRDPAARFDISTPSLITSVRGTDYRVSTEETNEESRAEVLMGKVDVSGGGATRRVQTGYGAIGRAQQPLSEPIKLLARPNIDGEKLSMFDRVPIQFKLPPLQNAIAYRLQIARGLAFDEILFDQRQATEQIRGPDLPDGEYWLRIRGIDGNGLEGQNAETKFLLNARPAAPFPVGPKPGAGVAEESPAFSWSRLESAQGYHFQIARDTTFGKLVVDMPNLTDNNVTIEKKLRLGVYFWRVSAIEAQEGEGPFSDPQELRRVPPAPQANQPEIGDDSMDIRWRAGSAGQQYQFQMADEDSFSKPMIDIKSADAKISLPTPDGGTYYVRIRTIDPDGFIGPFGTPQSIDVPRSPYWWLLSLTLFALFAI